MVHPSADGDAAPWLRGRSVEHPRVGVRVGCHPARCIVRNTPILISVLPTGDYVELVKEKDKPRSLGDRQPGNG